MTALKKPEKHILEQTWLDFLIIRFDAKGNKIAAQVSHKDVHLPSAESLIEKGMVHKVHETSRLVSGRKELWVSYSLTPAGRVAK